MKKSRKRLTFAAAVAGTALAASLTACRQASEPVETVYGPPDPLIGTYDPASEIQEDVYGPPSDYVVPDEELDTEDGANTGSSTVNEEEPRDSEPADVVPTTVYGPPSGNW